MKKLLLFAILAINSMAFAQVQFGTKEYFTASIAIDPIGSYNEKSANLTGEIELVTYGGFVKVNSQILPALEGGYIDLVGSGGVNLTLGIFEETRFYLGPRLGAIKRGEYIYGLVGAEAGIDQYISDKVFIGIRGSIDRREDFLYTGAKPEGQWSTTGRIGFKF